MLETMKNTLKIIENQYAVDYVELDSNIDLYCSFASFEHLLKTAKCG